jgi:hypothetical protein
MNFIRCEHCGTFAVRRGPLAGARCTSCRGPLLAPGLGEDDVRSRLYTRPRYVERVDRRPLAPAVPLRSADAGAAPPRADRRAA